MRPNLKLFTFVATLFVALMFTTSASAQIKFSYRDSLGTYKVRFFPHVDSDDAATRFRIPLVANTGEFRLGTAAMAMTSIGYTNDNYWVYDFDPGYLDNSLYYTSPRWLVLGLEGGAWIKEWLYVGGTVVYTGGFRTIREAPHNKRVGSFNFNCYSFMPTVRFAWVRSGIVQLYSGLSLGLSVSHFDYAGSTTIVSGLAYDVTFVGISVGRKLFGYCDLGVGSRGVVSAGIGFRFNGK